MLFFRKSAEGNTSREGVWKMKKSMTETPGQSVSQRGHPPCIKKNNHAYYPTLRLQRQRCSTLIITTAIKHPWYYFHPSFCPPPSPPLPYRFHAALTTNLVGVRYHGRSGKGASNQIRWRQVYGRASHPAKRDRLRSGTTRICT